MGTRRERVILDLEDRLSAGMAKAAASTGLLNRELDSLSRDSVRTRRAVSDIDQPIQSVGNSSERSGHQIDRLSGRIRILADVATILGPSLVPIGAVAVPAMAGLAAQFGFAAVGAGTALLAFQGVGDAVTAMNKAALEPTAANITKARIALERLSPSAQAFVTQIGEMRPALRALRDEAAEGLFPGLSEALDSLESALPRVQSLVGAVASELGDIAADTGESLASERWTPFLNFIETEAPEALRDMSDAAGNTIHAMANLWMAFDPLNDDFSNWLVDATRSLDQWSAGLAQTQGFQEFVAYIRENGPQVADTFAAIGDAVLQILEAAAPLGGPVLAGIEALANVVAAIADSNLGTLLFSAAAGLALFNRTLAITAAVQKGTFGGPALGAIKATRGGVQGLTADVRAYTAVQNSAAGRARASAAQMDGQALAAGRLGSRLKTISKGAGALAGLAVASTGAADGIGLTNTASLGLLGTLGGPWGAGIGAGIGLTLDLAHANDGLEDAIKRVNAAARSGDFSTLNADLKGLKKQVDDIKNTTGVGDFFGDQFSKIGDAITHPFDISPGDERVDRAEEAEANAETARTAALAAAKMELLDHGFRATAAGADRATQSATDFQAGLQKLNDSITGRASFRDYQAALDGFSASIKENGKTLDVTTEKGRANQAALDGIASSALAVAQTLTGTERATFLDAARVEFIKAAREAGLTKAAAKDLADEVLGLKNVVGRPKIVIDPSGAYHVIDDVQRRLRQFKDKTVRLTVLQVIRQTDKNRADFADNHAFADGGTVPGPRYPYRDSVVALLAGTEEIIPNRHGEADRYRADRSAGRIPAYADGGMVGRSSTPAPVSVSSGLSETDVDRIVRGLATMRPFANNVTVQPHNYNEFRSEEEKYRRMGGIGGPPRG